MAIGTATSGSLREALLWWRQLLTEVGSTEHTASGGEGARLAREHAAAVVELFHAVVGAAGLTRLIEVGAHRAETSHRFARGQPDGVAHAYEASRVVFERFVDEVRPDNMRYLHEAVGSEAGTARLLVPVDERLLQWGSTMRRAGNVATREESVPMITLDEAAARLPAPTSDRRDLALWIDVEGAVADVLAGGTRMLGERCGLVFVELYDGEPYEGATNALDVLAHMLDRGFVPLARDNQFRDGWNLVLAHESAYVEARETIAGWMYAQAGFARQNRTVLAHLNAVRDRG